MIKKILCAFLMIISCGIVHANIHIDGSVVRTVILEQIDNEYQLAATQEYEAQLKATGDSTMSASGLYKVCTAAGWDIGTPEGKTKCDKFVNALLDSGTYTYYEVCGPDKGKSGGTERCIDNVFYHWYTVADTQVTMLQADGLCKEYAKVKFKDDIECNVKPRKMDQNEYVQCTSKLNSIYYEFKFDDVEESTDAKIQNGVMESLCTIYDLKYQKSIGTTDASGNVNMTVPYCETKDANICKKISESGKRFNYYTEIRTGNFYGSGYCGFYQTNKIYSQKDLQTAYGIKNDVFYNGKIQTQASKDLKDALKRYVANTIKPEQLQEFDCNDNAIQIGSIRGKSDNDDVLTCYANGKRIDFVFDDLSEAWKIYDKSGHEAMNCIVWGGTFTGKKCIGIDEQMCNVVRDANQQSCPECRLITWNPNTKICELPESVSATNLKRGLTYSAIVGGAVASVVITVGTAGTGTITAGTAIIMLVETAGAAIELGAQINIDNKSDKFFVDSANCNLESCAKDLVNKYLIELARIGRDLTDIEADAIDKEMARLIGLIPTNSDWWIDYLRNDDGTSLLEKANDGGWTPAQIWRAIGIGMQFFGVASSITGWILKKTGYLEKTLDRTSKILLNSARTAEKNIVKVDELDDISKEWYKLWQEYAPKSQTFDQFKAMAHGDLDEMKRMTKLWIPRSKKPVINAQIDKQLGDLAIDLERGTQNFESLMAKYNIDALPMDPDKLAKLYKQYPDLKQATQTLDYTRSEFAKLQEANVYYSNTSYSTYDPKMSQAFKEYNVKGKELRNWWNSEYDKAYQRFLNNGGTGEFTNSDEYAQMVKEYSRRYDDMKKTIPTQWQLAEDFQLENLGNVVNERAKQFEEIIKNNPEIKSKLNDFSWGMMSDQERADVAQKILDEYAVKTGTPHAEVGLDVGDYGGYHTPGTNNVVFNPNSQLQHYEGMVETMAHEHGHLIDDLAPNEGALGEQYAYYGDKIYSNKKEQGYRVALTEQSSFKMGPNVSHEVTGTTHYSYGKEYDLEAAKRATSKPELDLTVATYGAAVPAAGGGVVGTEIQVINAILDKKDKK